MSSVGFFFADQNSPFLVTAVVTLVIAGIEILSVLLGLGLSDLIDDVMPDLDIEGDLDTEMPDAGGGILADAMSWLNVGRVPFLVLLIAFLTLFTVSGYGLQLLVGGALGFYLPALLAAPAALAAALPATRWTSRGLARIVPREETYATGNDDLVGRVATVTLGPVTRRAAGKAKVADRHGNLHFVRVRAASRGERFQTDAEVLLVGYKRSLFEVIAPPGSLSSNQNQDGE
ncbi:OB-fold-containig protein [Pelagibius sp.]|uniref:OB-fold-containig protein n=1 Tax=Pelagibius sp. TaxID=1931238 RepID=UPI00262F0E44|nr:OB-fold-containig protein [Pelagibius sp.]